MKKAVSLFFFAMLVLQVLTSCSFGYYESVNTAQSGASSDILSGNAAGSDTSGKRGVYPLSIELPKSSVPMTFPTDADMASQGIEVTVTYSDLHTETITAGYTCDPDRFTEEGPQQLTVQYGGVFAQTTVWAWERDNFEDAKVGDTVHFGDYEQDNSYNNNQEQIEWIVLEKQDTKLFLVSKYAVANELYDESGRNVTWEKCSLRTWLNEYFYSKAFCDSMQKGILTTAVQPDPHPDYPDSPAGNATEDKIFILSRTEVLKYFPTKESRKCAPSPHMAAHGSFTNPAQQVDGMASGCWWTRTPNKAPNYITDLNSDGFLSCYPANETNNRDSVRPCMWVDYSEWD